MQTGGILRRDQQEKELGGIAVQRIEIDAAGAAAEHAQDAGDSSKLAMRDGDAVADSGGAQALAFVQNPEQFVERDLLMGMAQTLSQLVQDLGLALAAQ